MNQQLLGGSGSESEENLSVHLAEITSLNWPTSESLVYRCRVAIHSPFESKPLIKDLPTRSHPAWMLDYQHQGACRFKLSLAYRRPESEGLWTDLGEVEVDAAEALAKETSVNVSLPISDWDLAPRLRLKMRFYKTFRPPGQRQRGLGRLPRPREEKPTPTLAPPAFLAAGTPAPFDIPDDVPMTPQEKVLVKDSWNKFLAFKELSLDMYIKRLLAVAPDLPQRVGLANDLLAERFFGLFDLTVRQLIPHTENILREAYRGIHPSPELECNTVEEYGAFFAANSFRPQDWQTALDAWMWVLPTMPYIEEYEGKDLERGQESALHKFFTGRVMRPMLEALREYEQRLTPDMLQRVQQGWQALHALGAEAGRRLYGQLVAVQQANNNGMADLRFADLDLEKPSQHVFASFEGTLDVLRDWDHCLPELRSRHAAQRKALPTTPVDVLEGPMLGLLDEHVPGFDDSQRTAWRNMFGQLRQERRQAKTREDHVLQKATEYLTQFADEWGWKEGDLARRLAEVQDEIAATGTYTHTYEELAFGMQLAWRNSSKCVGRMQWKNLLVRDVRHIQHPDEIFEECLEHLKVANNGGRLQSLMSIFRPRRPGENWGPRIWNSQLLRYAGYRQSDGSILGDPANAGLTEAILNLGWTPPSPKTEFDFLPLVIEVPGKQPSVYDIPRDMVLEVELEHPTIPQFADLGLKWFAVPAISNFRIVLGGVDYACLPFNGWFLCTEIARNLTDASRYNKVEEIARNIGLDMKNDQTMWRDEAYLELNKAIIHSFQKNKVIIVDQHSVSRQFLTHDLREKEAGRECPAQWSWVVPPLGGSVCPVYHHEMRDFLLEPQYYHAADRWAIQPEGSDHAIFEEQVMLEDERGESVESMLILFSCGSPSLGRLARVAGRRLDRFAPRIRSMASLEPARLVGEKMVLLVTSGEAGGASLEEEQQLLGWLQQQTNAPLKGLNFAVLGLGDPQLADGRPLALADALDKALAEAGGNRVLHLQRREAGRDQATTFNRGVGMVSRLMGKDGLFVDDANLGRRARLSVMQLDDGASLPPFSPPTLVPRPQRVTARVMANEVMEVGSGSKSLRRVILDLGDAGASLQRGHVLSIFTPSDPVLVQRLCGRLALQPHGRLTARYLGSFGEVLETELPFMVPTTVGELLTHSVDLHLEEPVEDWIDIICRSLQGEEKVALEASLRHLRAVGSPEYVAESERIKAAFPTVCDLLDRYPTAQVRLADVLELARYPSGHRFSIAEHLTSGAGYQVTILVDVAEGAADGRNSGHYLATCQPGAEVQVSASGLVAPGTENHG